MSRQVKQKAAEIDAMIAANAAAARGETPPDTAEMQFDDAPVAQPLAEATVHPIVSQPEPVIELPPLQQPDPLAQAIARADAADQRWKSLEGQLRSRDAQIERLTDLVANMAPPAEPAAPPPAVGVQDTDRDAFGEDMIEFVQRVARSAVQAPLQEVWQVVNSLTQNVQVVAQHTAKSLSESFAEGLDALSPRWREFDTTPEFAAWLDASHARRDLFKAGCTAKDATVVSEIFNLYMFGIGQAAPAAPAASTPNNVSRLEMQVAPGKSRSGAAPAAVTPKEAKNWTRTEIAAAYKRFSKGEFTKDEWTALEREIEAAQRDQRVDYSR